LNAAVELAEILQMWSVHRSHSIYDVRGDTKDKGNSLGYWEDYQRVMDLIADLDYALNILQSKGKPRSRYNGLMTRIWRFVILPDTNWGAPNTTSISPDDIHHLFTLGDVIEAHVPEANAMPEANREILLDLLEEASKVSKECQDLPMQIRTRLSDLLNQLGNLLDPVNDAIPRQVHRVLDEMTALLLRAIWAEPKRDLRVKLFNLALRFSQTTGESASYDIIKSIAATPAKQMLGLPTGEES